MSSFQESAIAILRSANRKPRTPDELLAIWEEFVAGCEEGYDWTIYEYDDELGIRDHIELILSNAECRSQEGFLEFAQKVEALDQRFRKLLQPGVARPHRASRWWEAGILRFAGEEYRDDIQKMYGIHVAEE